MEDGFVKEYKGVGMPKYCVLCIVYCGELKFLCRSRTDSVKNQIIGRKCI